MGKSKKRRRSNKARRAARLPKEQDEDLPPNFISTVERGTRVLGDLGPEPDLPAEIESRRQQLREHIKEIDAVLLLGQICMTESLVDPNTYAETTHPGSAYIIELLAAELLHRDDRQGRGSVVVWDAKVLEPVRELIAEANLLESYRRMNNAGYWSGPEGAARGRMAAQHLFLRSPGWWWQEEETLRSLFGGERFATVLRERLGFECDHALRIANTVSELTREKLFDWMDRARDGVGDFDPEHPAYQWAEEAFTDKWKEDPENAARFIPFVWALNHVGEGLLFRVEEVAERARVEPRVAEAFLAQMSIPFGQTETDWFRLAETVRRRPYVEVERGIYLQTVPGADLWALRDLFEESLKKDSSYLSHRGEWLERRVGEVLAPVLKPDEIHSSLRFDGCDGEYPAGEIDVLLRCGTTAIAIEAKSATMRPGARRGGEALISHLRANLTKASAQGEAARKALAGEADLFSSDGTVIKLGERILELQTIMVTLDDLSAVAPVIWELQGSKTLPPGRTAPWVVTLHELEQVAATIPWPLVLIHFLRRRSRLNEIGNQVASDELDWWMHYLLFGLYFEDEREGPRVRHTSLTDPLDQWFLHDRGFRQKPAPKPTLQIPKTSAQFIETLCSERPPGWVESGCVLLDGDTKAQEELWRALKKLRKIARRKGKVQRVSLSFVKPLPLLVCALAANDASGPELLTSMRLLLDERFVDHGPQRALVIGSLASSKRLFDALVVVAPQLEAAALEARINSES